MGRIFCIVVCIIAAGCASTDRTPTAEFPIVQIPAELVAAGSNVAVLDAIPDGAVVLGQVSAHPCAIYLTAPQPTDEYAIALLKKEAAALGANAITAVSLQHANVDPVRNCFTTIHATATALKT